MGRSILLFNFPAPNIRTTACLEARGKKGTQCPYADSHCTSDQRTSVNRIQEAPDELFGQAKTLAQPQNR